MRFRSAWLAGAFIQLFSFTQVNAQLKIVVIGSSTAAGVGASDRTKLGWVGLLTTYYQEHPLPGQTVSVINLAIGGTTTRDGLPGTCNGISAALSYTPDIVLVNYPSNDVAIGISKEETLTNLQTIFNSARAEHVSCFITTSQPRNFSENSLRLIQYQLRNNILNAFGIFALNFWDCVATNDGTYRIRPEYAGNPDGDPNEPPDGTHLNDAGHMALFNVVVAKDIFAVALPVVWGDFSASLNRSSIELKWSTLTEKNNCYFLVQRSPNPQSFATVAKVVSRESSNIVQYYNYIDDSAEYGINYYRIAQVDFDGAKTYSRTISIARLNAPVGSYLYPSPATNKIYISITTPKAVQVSVAIFDAGGRQYIIRVLPINAGSNTVTIPIQNLSAGMYFLKLQSPGWIATRKFVKD